MNRFKNPALRLTYDTMMSMARDADSELYVTPSGLRIIDKQGRNRRTGASHRNAFWAGFDGLHPTWIDKTSLNYAAFRAGQDFAKETAERLQAQGGRHADTPGQRHALCVPSPSGSGRRSLV